MQPLSVLDALGPALSDDDPIRAWLRSHPRLSAKAVNTLVRAGRGLEHLPAVDAACTAGHLTIDQAAVLAKAVTPAALEAAAAAGVDLAEIERALLAVAAAEPHHRLEQAVAHYLACLDPDQEPMVFSPSRSGACKAFGPAHPAGQRGVDHVPGGDQVTDPVQQVGVGVPAARGLVPPFRWHVTGNRGFTVTTTSFHGCTHRSDIERS